MRAKRDLHSIEEQVRDGEVILSVRCRSCTATFHETIKLGQLHAVHARLHDAGWRQGPRGFRYCPNCEVPQ